MSMTEASSRYFRQVAGQWDQIRAGYFGPEVRQSAIAKAYLRPEMAVADVGGGTGFLTEALAGLVRRVYLVDASEEMLAVARKNLSRWNNVEFHLSDGLSLPFPDESLDAVFANMYLHHTPNPQAAIAEMVRILRPGGRLVITDLDEHPYAWLKEEMADVWQGFARSSLRRWLQAAGLVNIIVDCTGQSCCARSTSPSLTDPEGHEAVISVFVATGTRRLPMQKAVQENYAALAENSSTCSCNSSTSTSCCSSEPETSHTCCCSSPVNSEVDFSAGYTAEELASAPEEAAEFSLGCGNPFAFASLKPGEVVLDIGSGGGLDAFLAAQKVGLTGRVIGVDLTPAMLERARATAARTGLTNVEFRQGEAEALPVEDQSIDVILSNCVINLTEDKGQVFREAFRVLKPGGHLEVSDVVTSGSLPFELQIDTASWAGCITGALPESEYIELMAQAGFTDIVVRRSPPLGQAGDVAIYSAGISARRPTEETSSNPCGCGAS